MTFQGHHARDIHKLRSRMLPGLMTVAGTGDDLPEPWLTGTLPSYLCGIFFSFLDMKD